MDIKYDKLLGELREQDTSSGGGTGTTTKSFETVYGPTKAIGTDISTNGYVFDALNSIVYKLPTGALKTQTLNDLGDKISRNAYGMGILAKTNNTLGISGNQIINGNYIYQISGATLTIFQINPSTLAITQIYSGVQSFMSSSNGFGINSNYLFIHENPGTGSKIHTVDITDPLTPTFVNTFDSGGFAGAQFFTIGAYGYINNGQSITNLQIKSYNLINPISGIALINTYTGNANDIGGGINLNGNIGYCIATNSYTPITFANGVMTQGAKITPTAGVPGALAGGIVNKYNFLFYSNSLGYKKNSGFGGTNYNNSFLGNIGKSFANTLFFNLYGNVYLHISNNGFLFITDYGSVNPGTITFTNVLSYGNYLIGVNLGTGKLTVYKLGIFEINPSGNKDLYLSNQEFFEKNLDYLDSCFN